MLSRYLCRNVCASSPDPRLGGGICAGCNEAVGENWIVALDNTWHDTCFCCNKCKIPIDKNNSFFCGKGLRMCVDCAKKNDPRIRDKKICHGCNKGIGTVWVVGMDKQWHTECFKCCQCNRVMDPNVRFLTRKVDDKTRKVDDKIKKAPRCTECADLTGEKRCSGCDKVIDSTCVVALNAFWHNSCFKCLHCQREIDSNGSFYTESGRPMCADCNSEHLRNICTVCKKPITGTSLIYDDYTYHHGCVNCFICGESLKECDHEKIRSVSNGNELGDFKHADCTNK